MESYEVLLFLHVALVTVWVGAASTMDLLFWRAERMRNPLELKTIGELQEWLVPRLFIPASLATLVSGVLLAWDGPWTFGELWIALGLVGFAAGFLTGFLYLRPQGEKMKEIMATHGPTSVEARRHAKRLLVVSRVQLLVLFLIIADMAIKPSGDDPWTLVLLGGILLAAVAAAIAVLRRPLAAEGPAAEAAG